jgi:hypothetical protein
MEMMPALVDWSEAVKRCASGTLHDDLIDALDDGSSWVRDIDLDNDSAYVLSQADVFDALAAALDPAEEFADHFKQFAKLYRDAAKRGLGVLITLG